ncbi:acyl carrier protein [Sodalis glossinidius]|uniref:AcpM n=1 Tax=Sodalis glossinidius TaxID=63612 RepID=Q6R8C2_SODGL|nr:phosphopantetheine-binding protein [Sodalis glossinidius]AAS66854.1 AcpM [Sodalis glossinidius]
MSQFNIVIGVLSDVTGRHPSDIKPQNELFFDLEMDSVDLIDVIIRLEDRGIIIKEKDLTPKLTVSDLIQVVSISGATSN